MSSVCDHFKYKLLFIIFRLSAFVLKSFVQAKPYIFVSDDNIHKTIDWILKYQNGNGTFSEPGKVLHKEMQVCDIRWRVLPNIFVIFSICLVVISTNNP